MKPVPTALQEPYGNSQIKTLPRSRRKGGRAQTLRTRRGLEYTQDAPRAKIRPDCDALLQVGGGSTAV